MRIACTSHHRQLVGGTESYLKRIIPELSALGHTVSFWHEGAVSPGLATVDAPEVFPVDSESPKLLADWRPDLIFNNGLMEMAWGIFSCHRRSRRAIRAQLLRHLHQRREDAQGCRPRNPAHAVSDLHASCSTCRAIAEA